MREKREEGKREEREEKKGCAMVQVRTSFTNRLA
jgi:hypothetical protein